MRPWWNHKRDIAIKDADTKRDILIMHTGDLDLYPDLEEQYYECLNRRDYYIERLDE